MNKSVELIKSEIYEVKSNLQKFTDLSKKEPENEAHSFYVTYFTNRLTILQQIKSILEAWEIVKDARKKLHFGFSYHKDIETNKIELIVSFTTEEKNKETLIKALEVEEK